MTPPPPPSSPLLGVARLLRFWAIAFAILVGCSFLKPLVPPSFGPLLWGLTSSCLLLALLAFFQHMEHRTWRQSGLHFDSPAAWHILGGVLLGLAVYAAILLLTSALLGPIRLEAGSTSTLRVFPLVMAGIVALALMEELAFRSYAFWTATSVLGVRGGQVLVAVAFALLHLAYGWAWPTVALGVLPSAVLFGAAAYASGGLALPLGVHIGINLGRWLTGEADRAGPWSLGLQDADLQHLQTWAPLIGAAVPLAVSMGLWWWGMQRQAPRPAA
jgi:membrane protease YdiL (CAAX protease family)